MRPRLRTTRALLAAAVCLALLVGAGLLPAPAAAATIVVTNGSDFGAGSLRTAIATAAAGDTIAFASGVTTVTLTSGQLGINKNLTIQGTGLGGVIVERNTSSGNFRIFEITGGATVTLKGLTIRNGRGGDTGGGVRNLNSTLTVEDCVVSDNQVIGGDLYGGGLANHATSTTTTLTVTNSTFQNNSGTIGSAIGNRAPGGTANLNVTRSTFTANNSPNTYVIGTYIDGGNGTATVTESTITGNASTGLLSYGTNGRTSTMNVTGSTISNNAGQGLFNYGAGGGTSTFTVTNSTISGNGNTGAYNFAAGGTGNLTLSHVTMLDNGGTTTGVHVGTDTATGTTTTSYNRSVFGHSNASLTNYFFAGGGAGTKTRTSGGFNVSQKDLPGAVGTDLANTNPQPDPAGLADNGGPTKTIALLATSPARDLIPYGSCNQATDQRGLARPRPGGWNCDSGAVEAQSPWLTLAPDPVAATYGDTVTVTATLLDLLSLAPLAGKTLTFSLNGASQGTAVTDASGVANQNIALGAITPASTPMGSKSPSTATRSISAGLDDATLQVAQATTTTSGVADQTILLPNIEHQRLGDGAEQQQQRES
ncbi:MAG: right-handed parallel beta-helix repeat-containing protein [Thermomicrobiales bacterium]